MSWNDHDHRGEYAEPSHDHSFWDLRDVAERDHRHHDTESEIRGLREDLNAALERIRVLEQQTPQARQLQFEADQAVADLAESGHDRHGSGCNCPFCYYDDPDEPTSRDLVPEPPGWHDVPDPEESR